MTRPNSVVHDKKPRQTRNSSRHLSAVALVIFWSVWVGRLSTGVHAVESCQTTSECLVHVGVGSQCLQGNCTNPLANGCLANRLPGWAANHHNNGIRVCNSDDPPDAAAQGVCQPPSAWNYLEIRLYAQNWESPVLESWILQIILSELLQVPTSIESGLPNAPLNFYNPDNAYEFGISDDWHALILAQQVGDCRLVSRDPSKYQACAHFTPEVWDALGWTVDLVKNGTLEAPQGNGLMGLQSWYVPKFTGERDPRVLSYLGLQGESMRHTLAELFLRPTTWQEYCALVSPHHCRIPDGVAARAPQNANEYDRFFVPGLYTGHFRATEENNCTLHPTTCTGHIADYPCGWYSSVQPICYWLDIALQSDGHQPGCHGYTYDQMVEMWAAANATKSNLMMQWWQPDVTYESYLGTDAEFVPIILPPTTKECLDHQVSQNARCSNDTKVRLGGPLGVCGDSGNPLSKIISGGLYDLTFDPSIPEALRSPAYDVLQAFTFSGVDLSNLFEYYFKMASPREAVCQWLVDNLQIAENMIPRSYPRRLQTQSDTGPLMYVAVILGGISTLQVLWASWVVYRNRQMKVIRVAQIEFLGLLLFGCLNVSVGAIVTGIPPTNASCVATLWLINIGYTLELVPLVVKVAAINKLLNAARRMRRVTLKRSSLFGAVLLINVFVVVVLICWTVLDPAQKTTGYELTNTVTPDGATLVKAQYFCSSSSSLWIYLTYGWNGLLLLCATVLAFQTRKVRQEFNESQTLAVMIYSHVVILILRIITLFLATNISGTVLGQTRSILYSVDTIATICIYFIPKFTKLNSELPSAINKLVGGFAGASQGLTSSSIPSSSEHPGRASSEFDSGAEDSASRLDSSSRKSRPGETDLVDNDSGFSSNNADDTDSGPECAKPNQRRVSFADKDDNSDHVNEEKLVTKRVRSWARKHGLARLGRNTSRQASSQEDGNQNGIDHLSMPRQSSVKVDMIHGERLAL